MESNLENKARFFALYYGQKVLKSTVTDNANIDYFENLLHERGFQYNYLELTPLSSITDEDCIDVYQIARKYKRWMYSKDTAQIAKGSEIVQDIINSGTHWTPKQLSETIDYLRSKGYALPFMGLSVETMIEYGWIKLKTK